MNQTNVCRVKCKFCAFAKTQKQEDAYTFTADELVEDAVAQYEVDGVHRDPLVNGENPHVDFELLRRDVLRKLHDGAAGRAPQVLHGVARSTTCRSSRAARTRRCCAS